MHRDRAHLVPLEPLGEPVGAALRADEDEGEPALLLQQLDELLDLVLRGHRDELVVDLAGLVLARELGLDPDRLVRVGAGELADRSVERGREEHRLAVVRDAAQDLVDLRLEAHVEHPVGLVEDEDRDGVERDQPPVHQVLQPARGRDEHVGGLGLRGLGRDGHAAVDRGDLEPAHLAEIGEDLGHLHRELARRDEDEGGGATVAGLHPLDDRDREGERLAGARRGLGEHVMTGERRRDRTGLDLEGRLDSLRGEHADKVRAQPNRGKG